MSKNKRRTINLYDYYPIVELAVQRMILIKKALGIKVDDYHKELNRVMITFKELSSESETSCGYLTIKTWIDKEFGNKQKIDFYFDLGNN